MGIALRPGVAVIPMDGALQLRIGDDEVHVLRTDAPDVVARVLAAFDGRRDRDDVVVEVGPDRADLVDRLLEELARAGLVQAVCGAEPAPGIRGAGAAARVAIAGPTKGAELLGAILGEHGMTVRRASDEELIAEPCDVVVCLAEEPDLTRAFALNTAVIAGCQPALFVDASHGRHATVGPFYVPAESSCYRCFRARLHENTAAFDELLAAERLMLERGAPLAAVPVSSAHRHLVMAVAAVEVVAFVARHRPLRTLNRAITVSFDELRMWSEPVWRVPWCAACGRAGTT
jgi:bacteriocin biosynthesis cyclodehydratase domain-containing protein